MTVWTPEMDARLAELHATGASFKRIALSMNQEFKITLTSNAVIGRAHRNILPIRRDPTRLRVVKHASGPKPRWARKPRLAVVPQAPPLIPGRLTMMQLNRCTCHWPDGEKPPYTYCGEATYGDSAFCREHYERVYVKSRTH